MIELFIVCFHQIDIKSFSDADIEQALTKLSEGELQVLERVMESEVPMANNIKKRGVMEMESDKICDSRYGCQSRNSDDLDDRNYKQIITYEQLPGEFFFFFFFFGV